MARPLSLRRRVKVGKRSVPEDLRAVEAALVELGHLEPPKAGFAGAATRRLDDAIRRLQGHSNLKPDGIVKPHGPTAERINALLVARRRKPPAPGPEARSPPRGAPSFPDPSAATIHNNAMRELAGGAEAPEPARRRASAGRDDTVPPRRPGGGQLADTFRRMVPPTVADPTRAELERTARMTPENRRREFVESSDAEFHRFAKDWRKAGHQWAPVFIEHYLERTGSPIELTRKRARGFSLIGEAETTNRKRVEQSFVERLSPSGEDNVFYKSILPLIAGEATQTNIETDNWQVILEVGWRDSEFWNSQKDFGRAFGSLGVNAEVTGRARRVGDAIHVEGAVEHWLYDLYDFEGVPVYGDKAAALEQAGRARRFEIGAGWKQRFTAVIEIEDGEPRIKEFRWMDTSETVNWRANEKSRKKKGQESRKQAKAE